MLTSGCPGCSAKHADPHEVDGVVTCRKCGGVYTTRAIYKGDSYGIVLPQWADGDPAVTQYFDLTVVGSEGVERRHGWFDPATKRITQVG